MKEIAQGVFRIEAGSNAYFLKEQGILIDTGEEESREILLSGIRPAEVKAIILTHMHYDHTGNVECFNCPVYASAEEIISLKKMPYGTVLSRSRTEIMLGLLGRIRPVPEIPGLLVIACPGHTAGSIAILMDCILFSGDTLFFDGIGRTDLPTSVPARMDETLARLEKLDYRVLCPGH